MPTDLPVIAIVGRPNVGKSTLFNRLAGRRIAIVSDVPGTTRDRISIDAAWGDRRFLLVDTGGIEDRPGDLLWQDVRAQTARAIEEADAVILVVDASTGVVPGDKEAAELVRRSGKPHVLAANKADNLPRETAATEFYELGMADPMPVSAYHDRGIGDLMEALFEALPVPRSFGDTGGDVRVAIIGRPNVGKSALFNAITGEERAIVSPIPGTTRDSIDSHFHYDGRDLTILDTAGMRRRGKAGEEDLEKYSIIRTVGVIERSHICVLVLDATEFVTAQDTHIGGFIDEAARAAVIVVNKWDLARQHGLEQAQAEAAVRDRFKFLPGVPVLFTSALTGRGVEQVPAAVVAVWEQFDRRLTREELSRTVFDAIGKNPPPPQGTARPRIFKVTQSRTSPPTFIFTTRHPELIHFSYRRYLENQLRDAFGFAGSPIRMQFVPRDE
jgi:GTP-binding protein